jgi:hypothetical protein
MSPHSCRELDQFHLVMPSDVYYVLGEIRDPELAGKYTISVTADATCRDAQGLRLPDVKAQAQSVAVEIGPKE